MVSSKPATTRRSTFFTAGNSFYGSSDRGTVLSESVVRLTPRFAVQISESGTKMTLLSPLEDLVTNTLAALPGLLAKLAYLAGLKVNGRYGHWGLSRVHGEAVAVRTLAQAHEMVIAEVLRAPLRDLLEDTTACCVAREEQPHDFLMELSKQPTRLLPEEAGGGSSRHFNSVLHALSALSRNQAHATHPDA